MQGIVVVGGGGVGGKLTVVNKQAALPGPGLQSLALDLSVALFRVRKNSKVFFIFNLTLIFTTLTVKYDHERVKSHLSSPVVGPLCGPLPLPHPSHCLVPIHLYPPAWRIQLQEKKRRELHSLMIASHIFLLKIVCTTYILKQCGPTPNDEICRLFYKGNALQELLG